LFANYLSNGIEGQLHYSKSPCHIWYFMFLLHDGVWRYYNCKAGLFSYVYYSHETRLIT